LFEKAIAARAVWQDFPGFTAEIAGSVDGRRFAGQVEVDAGGAVKLKTDDEATATWVDDQLSSIVLHRQSPSGSRSQPVLYFADQDERHPLAVCSRLSVGSSLQLPRAGRRDHCGQPQPRQSEYDDHGAGE